MVLEINGVRDDRDMNIVVQSILTNSKELPPILDKLAQRNKLKINIQVGYKSFKSQFSLSHLYPVAL